MPSDFKQFRSTFLFRREPRATLSGVDNFGDVWRRPLPADCRRSFYLHPSQSQRRQQRAGQSRRTVQDVEHRRDNNHERIQRWRYFGDWRRYWLNDSFADVNECKHNPEWCKTMFAWLMLTVSTGVELLINSTTLCLVCRWLNRFFLRRITTPTRHRPAPTATWAPRTSRTPHRRFSCRSHHPSAARARHLPR